MEERIVRFFTLLLSFACFCSGAPVWAKRDGITGFSGLQGETCADSCHGDEGAPLLDVEGPNAVGPGEAAGWRVAMWPRQVPSALGGGVNIAVTAGELIPGAGLYLEAGELTHFAPARNADANRDGAVTVADVLASIQPQLGGSSALACVPGDVNGDGTSDEIDLREMQNRLFTGGAPLVWAFRWIAPPAVQEVQFFASGVAANCNGTRGGDGVGTRRWTVNVTSRTQTDTGAAKDGKRGAEP